MKQTHPEFIHLDQKAKMTLPNPAKHKPVTLDQLIPLIGDAVVHAQSLQGTAVKAVKGIEAATQDVGNAVERLEQAKANLAAAIASSVRGQVDAALVDSAATMGATLTTATDMATTALDRVSTASQAASDALLATADAAEVSKMKYVVMGGVLGAIVGASITGLLVWAYMDHSDLHQVVSWLVKRPR